MLEQSTTSGRNYYRISFLIGVALYAIYGIFKINHMETSIILPILVLIPTLAYVIIGIYEVSKSSRIEKLEKAIWILGFILLTLITGILYFLLGQKRIAAA